jgi:uncharacterized damage-inducible protein DinB
MVRVQKTLETWRAIREDTAQAVEDMPADALDFRAADGLMTFREIARHSLNAGNALTGLMLDGVTNLAVPGLREMMKQYSTKLPADASQADLAAALRQTVDQRIAELSARDDSFFAEEITRFDGMRLTRLEMLQTVKEHELTHRSQLFMYLRLKGVVPPTTRRREQAAKQAAGQASSRS